MDTQIQEESLKWADSIIEQFKIGQNPARPLQGESLDIYREMDEWGFFTHTPIDSPLTKIALGMRKYKALKWIKDHPIKEKPSKWEVVTGKSRGRR